MAKYIKVYVRYESDINLIKRRLSNTIDEIEGEIIEGEDSLKIEDIKN